MSVDVTVKEIEYPDCDGQPIADNTLQFEWIVTIKENLETLFASQPDVFVAGDLLWYPVEGYPEIRMAPDAMVVFGRPKGYRGSYMQWREGGVAPHVAFEVLSPGNRPLEMMRKFKFFEHYGVEEYYLYDPDRNELSGWIREGPELREIPDLDGWISPRLGIRFEPEPQTLRIFCPDGRPFVTFGEMAAMKTRAEQERQRAEHRLREAQLELKAQADELDRLRPSFVRWARIRTPAASQAPRATPRPGRRSACASRRAARG